MKEAVQVFKIFLCPIDLTVTKMALHMTYKYYVSLYFPQTSIPAHLKNAQPIYEVH